MKLKTILAILIIQLTASLVSNGSTREELVKIEFFQIDLTKSSNFALFQKVTNNLKENDFKSPKLSYIYQFSLSLTNVSLQEITSIENSDLSPYDKSQRIMELMLKIEILSKRLIVDSIIQKDIIITDIDIQNNLSKININESDFIEIFNDYSRHLESTDIVPEKISKSSSVLIELLKLVQDEMKVSFKSEDLIANKSQKIMDLLFRFNCASEMLIKKPMLDKIANAEIIKIQNQEAIKSGLLQGSDSN